MPSAAYLAGQNSVSSSAFRISIPRCLGWNYPVHYYYNREDVQAAQEHFNTHRVHHPRRRNPRIRVAEQPTTTAYLPPTRVITVGADPEFALMRGGRMIRASRILEGGTQSQIGTDGADSTGELRPHYGTANECFLSVDALLGRLSELVGQDIEIYAGAYKSLPMGGHIHIGGRGQGMSTNYRESLATFITDPLNSVSDAVSRNVGGYGHNRHEIRSQSHGVEFRSPPSWLSHPALALGALTIAEVIARQQRLDNPITTWEELIDLCSSTQEIMAIDAFRSKIANLISTDTKLEEIEVLKAWGKRKSIREPASQPEKVEITVNMSDGDSFTYMGAPGEYTEILRASSRSGYPNCVYIHRDVFSDSRVINRLHNVLSARSINYWDWEFRNIGLSFGLRRGNFAQEFLIETIEEVRGVLNHAEDDDF